MTWDCGTLGNGDGGGISVSELANVRRMLQASGLPTYPLLVARSCVWPASLTVLLHLTPQATLDSPSALERVKAD
jgi:hypothetical protein